MFSICRNFLEIFSGCFTVTIKINSSVFLKYYFIQRLLRMQMQMYQIPVFPFSWSMLLQDGIWISSDGWGKQDWQGHTVSETQKIGFLSPLIITGQTWPRAQSRQITVESETLYREPNISPHLINNHRYTFRHWDTNSESILMVYSHLVRALCWGRLLSYKFL